MKYVLLGAGLFSCCFLLPHLAFAHAKSISHSTWEITGDEVRVTVRMLWSDVARLEPAVRISSPAALMPGSTPEHTLARYLTTHLALFAGDEQCTPSSADITAVPSGDPDRIALMWTLRCTGNASLRLSNDAFFDQAPTHLHFARVRLPMPEGVQAVEKVFSFNDRQWTLSHSGRQKGTHFLGYLRLGIVHILSGTDHLAFLLGLLLATGSVVQVVHLVTGFTVAHSITLALSVLLVVRPVMAAVETLIGFSIVIVALENFWRTSLHHPTRRWIIRGLAASVAAVTVGALTGVLRVSALSLFGLGLFSVSYLLLLGNGSTRLQLRWFVAFVFGLIHGFGFAGVMAEMSLPPERLVPALCGFNIGVEIGQLGIVVVAWSLLQRMRGAVAVQLGSAAILAMGIFWFITRSVGG